MADQEQNSPQESGILRAQAAVLLSQARGQIADIQRALGAVKSGSGLHSRLEGAMAPRTPASG